MSDMPTQKAVHSRLALAFNRGSDARLAGLPLSTNPYPVGCGTDGERWGWISGWRDVDQHYGEECKVKPRLPAAESEMTEGELAV